MVAVAESGGFVNDHDGVAVEDGGEGGVEAGDEPGHSSRRDAGRALKDLGGCAVHCGADDPVAVGQQALRQVGAVLAGDSGDDGGLIVHEPMCVVATGPGPAGDGREL